MRYHIDTIPVWDAMKLDGECPLCAMRRKMELSETERYLGASVMEPDVRLQVNAKGFCRRHHGFFRQEHWSGSPFPSPWESFPPRDKTWVSGIAERFFNQLSDQATTNKSPERSKIFYLTVW